MAVLNPPRTLPSLGRSIVNFVVMARRPYSEEELVATLKPEGLNSGMDASGGIHNTVSSLRAISILKTTTDGSISLGTPVPPPNGRFTREQFRTLLQERVFDRNRDGEIWATEVGDGHTRGARDLNRALTWVLAQDALGRPLTWTDTVQTLQAKQFASNINEDWAIQNVARMPPLTRWALALGLVTPSVVRDASGIVPLPTVAIADVLPKAPSERMTIHEFIKFIGDRIPVLYGGIYRREMVSRIGQDPDPGVQADALDSSVGQALLQLEEQGLINFETLPDADGIRLSRSDSARRTHVTVTLGGKR